MVDNAIDRYRVNTSTEGLMVEDDGSFSIVLRRDEPTDPADRAEWLPAPEGDVDLIMRIHLPAPAVLGGIWEPPPVVNVS